jgi:phosphate transport system substrate-binding protein
MSDRPVSRRAALVGGLGLATSLGGCISTSATRPGSGPRGGSTTEEADGDDGPGLLRAGGSSTVYPVVSKAASYWGSNPPPSDEEYWGPSEYGIDTDRRLADYWAGQYGFETGGGDNAPFPVTVNLSHSGTGMENLRAGQVDIGNSSAPVEAELPEASEEELSKFTDHVVGVDAQPIVVSQAVYDAGVTAITGETLKAIYAGEIEDWSQVEGYDGPDKSIQAVGRAEGSGTDTAFRLNLFGDAETPIPGVDVRKGQNQQVKTLVVNSDNAIAYMALAFVDDSVPAITLNFGDKEFVPGENLADPDYPLARDLHCYTYEGTSRKEAAFLNMIFSDFGQETFVNAVGYSPLTDDRQRAERNALPDPEA